MTPLIAHSEPFKRITEWMAEAAQHPHIHEPTAISLATATAQGKPSLRTVLLKGVDDRSLIFYTNSESRKGEQLRENPQACLNFYWMPLQKQIRASGRVEPVTVQESDDYFASRRRGSQIGAWASAQSRSLDAPETLAQKVAEFEQKFEGAKVPRPLHWYGWRLMPEEIEFWQEKEFRLHHRERYTRMGDGWQMGLLYP